MNLRGELAIVRNLLRIWPTLKHVERKRKFAGLSRPAAEELFLHLSALDQVELVEKSPDYELRSWLRLLPLDDITDFLQNVRPEKQPRVLNLLDERVRHEVTGLLAYAEDVAGGLMNPEYIRLRPHMTMVEAIEYIRAQAKTRNKIYYAYVLDNNQVLRGVISIRDMLLESPNKTVQEIMKDHFISVSETLHREDVAHVFSVNNALMAIPVIDAQGRMKGVVTYDDIASVIEQATTKDMQKIGGMEALSSPYLAVNFSQLVKKRAGWLTLLFFGEMLTATALRQFEDEIAKVVILALFVPLIISSGGNSGSQASTLIIRSLALKEIRMRDWWRVFVRELGAGLSLGVILGLIGLVRILIWQQWEPSFSEHYVLIGITVGLSLVSVVVLGTLSGSMLPFLLRRIGLDPASASAPLVATLVDVTGLVIYFSLASMLLKGSLL